MVTFVFLCKIIYQLTWFILGEQIKTEKKKAFRVFFVKDINFIKVIPLKKYLWSNLLETFFKCSLQMCVLKIALIAS